MHRIAVENIPYIFLVLENTTSFLKSSILNPTMFTLYIQPDAIPLAGSLAQMSTSSLDHVERLLSRSLGRDTTGTGTCIPRQSRGCRRFLPVVDGRFTFLRPKYRSAFFHVLLSSGLAQCKCQAMSFQKKQTFPNNANTCSSALV